MKIKTNFLLENKDMCKYFLYLLIICNIIDHRIGHYLDQYIYI